METREIDKLKKGTKLIIIQFNEYKCVGKFQSLSELGCEVFVNVSVEDTKLKTDYAYSINVKDIRAIKYYHKGGEE